METAEPTAGAASPKRALSDEQIILPSREVTLTNGRRVVVEPWGMAKGARLLGRIDALQPVLAKHSEATVRELLGLAWDEIVGIVSETIDVPVEEMQKEPRDGGYTFEDLIALTEAVLEVCMVRADGRGALPLLVALVERMTQTAAQVLGPMLAKQRVTDSEPEATSAAASGNGSPKNSRRRRSRRS